MTDRVHPASKPNQPPSSMNGNAAPAVAATAAHTAAANGTAVYPQFQAPKSQLYNPNRPRPMYRPQPRPSRRCSCRKCCCLCFLYTLIAILCLILLAAIAASIFYVLYHPKHPTFSVSAVRIHTFNLSSPSDPATSYSHLKSNMDVTMSAKNPNQKINFLYDSMTVVVLSNSLQVGNATLSGFDHVAGNTTILKSAVASDPSQDLDNDSVSELRSDLKKKSSFPLSVVMNTKVKVKMGKLSSNRVGIRVVCDGVKGFAPKNSSTKSATVSTISNSKCKVDLRIKIWKFTF